MQAAVERVAPFVGFIYSTLVVWLADGALHQAGFAAPSLRPWYPHKRGLSGADVLHAAQRVLAPLEVLDPTRTLEDLRKTHVLPRRHDEKRHRRAA